MTTESAQAEQLPRLLFVDDEARILTSLKAVFRGDYEVHTAVGGEQAIPLMDQYDFDVIVSDQRMPGMTGVEVLREAKRRRPRAIRLLLTGYSDLSAVIGSINEGEIFRFISKPWSNNEIRATIAAAVQASTVEQMMLPDIEAAAVADAPAASGDKREMVGNDFASGDEVQAGQRNPGVLIVDPDPTVCSVLKGVLERDRPVFTAHSVEDGLDRLEQHRIGVIVTELVVNGEVVTGMLSALRQHHPTLVTVVLTGQADAAHSIDLINQGQVYRLLQKPVSEGLLRGTMNLASRRFELLETNPEQTRRVAVDPPPAEVVEKRGGLFARIRRLLRPGVQKAA